MADGGFVEWTAKLVGNGKECLLISGFGIERIALLRWRLRPGSPTAVLA